MQQELIEMLDKMVKYFDEIPSDSYYYRETSAILNEAEKLVEKAKKSAKEPAVPQGEPVTDEWVCKMAKRYAGTIVDRHGHNAFLFTLAELLAFIATLRGKEGK